MSEEGHNSAWLRNRKGRAYCPATARKWKELKAVFLAAGKDKGTATRSTNEVKLFFEDDGEILWITFIGEEFCWGFLDADPVERHPDGDGTFRKVAGGWKRNDLAGEVFGDRGNVEPSWRSCQLSVPPWSGKHPSRVRGAIVAPGHP